MEKFRNRTIADNYQKNKTKWFIVLILLISNVGCTSFYRVDLVNQRMENVAADMEWIGMNDKVDLPERISLSDAVEIGLSNNLELRVGRVLAQLADEKILSEKLKTLPNLDFSGTLSRRSNYNLREYKNLDTGEVTLGRSVSEEKTYKSLQLVLSWNLLDFGVSYIRSRQTAFREEISRMERLRQAQNLALEIAAAYWKTVLAEKDVDFILGVQKEVRAFRRKAEIMAAERRIDAIVVKTIEKKIVDMEIAVENLRSDISGSRIELCRLMGINPGTRFSLSDEPFKPWLDRIPDPSEMDAEKLERISLLNRPECFAADLEVRIQQDEARSALLAMFPGIRFDAGLHYDANKYLVDNFWTTIGTGFMAKLLQIPSSYYRWKAEDGIVESKKFRRRMISAGVVAQVHLALHDLAVRKRQYELQDESYRVSGELLEMSRERNKAGKISDIGVIQQLMDASVSRLQRNRLLVDYINAYNLLLVTLGLDFSRWNENPMRLDEEQPNEDIQTREIIGSRPIMKKGTRVSLLENSGSVSRMPERDTLRINGNKQRMNG